MQLSSYNQSRYLFYQGYVNLLDQDYHSRKAKELTEFEKKLRFSKFRTFFLDTQGYTYESILRIKRVMLTGMLRPQRLLIDNPNFYVACDMITNTYYICYRNLMMIDIDFYKGPEGEDNLNKIVEMFKHDGDSNNRCWILYRSKGGIHAFLVSHKMEYHSKIAVDLMIKLQCDFNYVVYSYLRGWCVRLNRKKKETEVNYTSIGTIGATGKALQDQKKLVNLHLNLVNVFKDETPCNMFGI